MNLSMKAFFLVFLLLFASLSADSVDFPGIRPKPVLTSYKGEVRVNSRKLLEIEAMLDYDYPGPNPKHDPRGGRKGGGRNP